MIREPKFKVCRRLGDKVYGKCQTPKFAQSLSRKPRPNKKRSRGGSEFKTQLMEKQKAKVLYGVTERQFANYVRKAEAKKGANPSSELFRMLEIRLDSVLYSLGFLPSKALARQVVTHGHIMVNSRKTNIPSYSVRIGDKISIRVGSKDSVLFADLDKKVKDKNLPAWVKFDKSSLIFEIAGEPVYEENIAGIGFGDVIEFYSRA